MFERIRLAIVSSLALVFIGACAHTTSMNELHAETKDSSIVLASYQMRVTAPTVRKLDFTPTMPMFGPALEAELAKLWELSPMVELMDDPEFKEFGQSYGREPQWAKWIVGDFERKPEVIAEVARIAGTDLVAIVDLEVTDGSNAIEVDTTLYVYDATGQLRLRAKNNRTLPASFDANAMREKARTGGVDAFRALLHGETRSMFAPVAP